MHKSTWMKLAVAAASSGWLLTGVAHAESLPELWKRPVKGAFTSAKTSLALEYCIGSVTSELGSPHLLHGEGVTDLWVGRPFAIRIEEAGNTRKVSYTASAGYDDRVDRAIRGCL